jgi:hypothetical protein
MDNKSSEIFEERKFFRDENILFEFNDPVNKLWQVCLLDCFVYLINSNRKKNLQFADVIIRNLPG